MVVRTRLSWLIGRLPVLILLIGLIVFVLGLVLQYSLNRPFLPYFGPVSAPFSDWALLGLAVATLTLFITFAVAGIMMARQTRLHGADYAEAYRKMDELRFAEAIPLLEQSILRGKETVEVQTLLARAYAISARYSLAHNLLDRAIELHPDHPAPYSTLGFLFLLEGNDEEAVKALQSAVERDPSPLYWADLGLALILAQRPQEALPALEKASRSPLPTADALRVYYHLMQFYTQLGHAAKAAGTAAKMVSARDGLEEWKIQARVLKGTGYGQRLQREVDAITAALTEADAAQMRVDEVDQQGA